MATKTINTRIGLKYDSYSAWEAVKDTFVPIKGEVIFYEIPAAAEAAVNEPAILFKVGVWNGIDDANTPNTTYKPLSQLPWGSAISADVYAWAKNESLLGGTNDGGTWTWADTAQHPEYAQEQAEVAAFVEKEVKEVKIQIVSATPPEGHEGESGWYKTQISTDNGTAWTDSSSAFKIDSYTAGSGITIDANNAVSVKTKPNGYITNTDDGSGSDTGIDVVASTVTYTAAGEGTSTDLTATAGVLTDSAVSQIKAYADAKAGAAAAASTVTVTPDQTPASGNFATYTIAQGGATVGTINIPKDFLVKRASVDTVTAADKADGGKFENDPNFAIGDKYIDFVVNSKDSDAQATEEHIYLNVKDLAHIYDGAQTQYITVSIDNTDHIRAEAITRTLIESHDTQYSFTSYSAEIGGTQYGTGVAELVEQDAATTTVKVISNSPYTEWTGRVFTVNAIEFESGHRYQLHENGTAIDVWVEISGTEPGVNGLATSLDAKNYIDNAVEQAIPNIEGQQAIEVAASGNSKVVSLKLNDDAQNNRYSGLKQGNNGLEINDDLTWYLQCGGAE